MHGSDEWCVDGLIFAQARRCRDLQAFLLAGPPEAAEEEEEEERSVVWESSKWWAAQYGVRSTVSAVGASDLTRARARAPRLPAPHRDAPHRADAGGT